MSGTPHIPVELRAWAFAFLFIAFYYVLYKVTRDILLQPRSLHGKSPIFDAKHRLSDLSKFRNQHELASVILNLIEEDGAGQWPPRVSYKSWPETLQIYHDIYQDLVPSLSCPNPSLDDQCNTKRCAAFRARMREMLNERVDLTAVQELLDAAEAGNWHRFRRDHYNGFYCAVGNLRHAYR